MTEVDFSMLGGVIYKQFLPGINFFMKLGKLKFTKVKKLNT